MLNLVPFLALLVLLVQKRLLGFVVVKKAFVVFAKLDLVLEALGYAKQAYNHSLHGAKKLPEA